MPTKNQTYSCYPCHACCVTLRIDSKPGYSTRLDNAEDIAKDAHKPCRYLNDNGCSIYEYRPIVCRTFRCDWLLRHQHIENHPMSLGYFSINKKKFIINN